MHVLRTGIAGLACAGLLAVVGCTGKPDQASTELPPTTTPTSAPSTTAAPTTTPPATPTPTAATAIALAVRANTALNILYARQDPAPLRAISDGCQVCEKYIGAFLTKKRAGYHFSGSKITITGKPHYLGYDAPSKGGGVSILVSSTAGHTTDPHGRPYVSPTDPAGGGPAFPHVQFTCVIIWLDTHWALRGFTYEVQ